MTAVLSEYPSERVLDYTDRRIVIELRQRAWHERLNERRPDGAFFDRLLEVGIHFPTNRIDPIDSWHPNYRLDTLPLADHTLIENSGKKATQSQRSVRQLATRDFAKNPRDGSTTTRRIE
jgi:hypothetical protein